MATLFQLPKVTGLPGSKLFFFRTGTSTPQDVYTDADLNVAHSQPVEADAAGVFAPIYLDPTLPDYRVSYYTSADVLNYTVDDVPSNQNVQQSMRLEATNPSLVLFDSDGTVNNRKYRIRVNGNQLLVEAGNDAESVWSETMRIEGGNLTLAEGSTIFDGSGIENDIADKDTGSFTGTLTGLTTSPTSLVLYRRVGYLVYLRWAAQSATSNATSLTVTGMPSEIIPGSTSVNALCAVTDNSTTQLGTVSVTSAGVITFGVGASGGNFTNSGTKGFPAGMVVYPIA